MSRRLSTTLAATLALSLFGVALWAASDSYPFLHHEGELYGSLKSAGPLPIYDKDPNHVWNRLYAALYVRESNLPSHPGGSPVKRYEGGDGIDFLAWSGSTYWSEPATIARIEAPLDELLKRKGEIAQKEPLKRVLLQRDLWAAHDFYVNQNIIWAGTREDRRRRERLAKKLAQAIAALALPTSALEKLPDNYAVALASGAFAPKHDWDAGREYLPPGLFTNPEEWIEVDFWRPLDIHEDIEDRFVALHTRAFKGRSVFRVFYRWPGGRPALEDYLKYLDAEGIDWKFAASRGFVRLNKGLKQIPAGTEVALVQSLTALDDRLNPVPTKIVETVRLRTFKNAEGVKDDRTHSGNGMNVYEYILRRRLAFDGLKNGGLEREPNEMPQYRVIFEADRNGKDWGSRGRFETVRKQCLFCHTGSGPGVYGLATIINSGGVDAGAQIGVVHAVPLGQPSPHLKRDPRYKLRDETYRRLVEAVGR
jgi:hypothetical protein